MLLLLGVGGVVSLLAAACGDDDAEPAATTTAETTAAATTAAASSTAAVSTAPVSTAPGSTAPASTAPGSTAAASTPTTPGSTAAATPLEGTTWMLTSNSPLGAALGRIAVTARFEAGMLTGESGCNSYNTTYEISGSSMTIGPNIASTLRACPPPKTAVEQAYLDRLPRTASYTVEGSTLTLADSGGATLLGYQATDSAEGILGEWNATSYYAGNAVTSVLGGATLTAEFDAGTISGNTGCNSFNGPYSVDGQSIEIGPLSSTRAACPNEELQQQEQSYLAALELATTFEITGNRLDLFRPGHTIAATFERP
jgi:heat shock protein HslJ